MTPKAEVAKSFAASVWISREAAAKSEWQWRWARVVAPCGTLGVLERATLGVLERALQQDFDHPNCCWPTLPPDSCVLGCSVPVDAEEMVDCGAHTRTELPFCND